MGISGKTVKRIEDAIAAEAATMHDAKGVKAVVSIKENEEKMKQLRVRGRAVAAAGQRVCLATAEEPLVVLMFGIAGSSSHLCSCSFSIRLHK